LVSTANDPYYGLLTIATFSLDFLVPMMYIRSTNKGD